MNAHSQSGYSLVELVLTITILSILAVGFSRFFIESTLAYDWLATQANLSPSARLALDRMGREIAAIRNTSSIYAMTDKQLSFHSVDGDSLDLSWSGASGAPLTLSKNGTGTTLASAVDSLGFSYFASGGGAAALPSLVWRVRVRLRVAEGAHKVTYGNSIYVRNH